MRDPGAPQFFGKNNDMPRFAGKLSEVELEALAQLLRGERAGAASAPPREF